MYIQRRMLKRDADSEDSIANWETSGSRQGEAVKAGILNRVDQGPFLQGSQGSQGCSCPLPDLLTPTILGHETDSINLDHTGMQHHNAQYSTWEGQAMTLV